MNVKIFPEAHQTKARRWWRCGAGGATHRLKQCSLYDVIGFCSQVALRHSYAVQLKQQRSIACLYEIHERETRLDFIRYAEQGQKGVDRPRTNFSNSARSVAKQGQLVWPDVVSTGHCQRTRDIDSILAPWGLFILEASRSNEAKTKVTSSEKHNVLSVVRIHRPNIYPYSGHGGLAVYPYTGHIERGFK